MTFEIDHIFIWTDIGAIVADRLISLGLIEGSSNIHPGQGTTNRRFFFHNAMLELLWVHDLEEAQSDVIRRTRLGDRWVDRNTGACPFGIAIRPSKDSDEISAFSTWDYHPPYLPPTISIRVGNNSEVLTEPFLFQTPFGKRPDRFPPEKVQPIEHRLGLRELTHAVLVSPDVSNLSPEFQALLDTGKITLKKRESYCLELSFDTEKQGQKVDLRPELPLVMKW